MSIISHATAVVISASITTGHVGLKLSASVTTENAIIAPLQGSAADIIKLAMVDIYREMSQRNLRSRMILQVHDELVFDVVPEEKDEMIDSANDPLKKLMQDLDEEEDNE